MSHYMSCNLIKKNIDNFSLIRENKNKIFGFIKIIRNKHANLNTKFISRNYSISRNDLVIYKNINFNYIKYHLFYCSAGGSCGASSPAFSSLGCSSSPPSF